MAISFVLVSQGPQHLTYLASSSGQSAACDTGTIQPTGAGDADVAMDLATILPSGRHAGLLWEIVRMTSIVSQSLARQQLLDWGLAPVTGAGISNVPGKRCRASIQQVGATCGSGGWTIDADTNGAGRGEYNVSCTSTGGNDALILIQVVGTPQNT